MWSSGTSQSPQCSAPGPHGRGSRRGMDGLGAAVGFVLTWRPSNSTSHPGPPFQPSGTWCWKHTEHSSNGKQREAGPCWAPSCPLQDSSLRSSLEGQGSVQRPGLRCSEDPDTQKQHSGPLNVGAGQSRALHVGAVQQEQHHGPQGKEVHTCGAQQGPSLLPLILVALLQLCCIVIVLLLHGVPGFWGRVISLPDRDSFDVLIHALRGLLSRQSRTCEGNHSQRDHPCRRSPSHWPWSLSHMQKPSSSATASAQQDLQSCSAPPWTTDQRVLGGRGQSQALDTP